MSTLGEYIKNLKKDEKHELIFSKTEFHKTEHLKKEEGTIFRTEYKCDDDKCDFKKAIKDIETNTLLQNDGKKDDLFIEIIKDIENNNKDYHPQDADGFLLKWNGIVMVKLQQTYDFKNGKSYEDIMTEKPAHPLTGIVQVDEIQEACHENLNEKVVKTEFTINHKVSLGGSDPIGCEIM